MTQFEKAFYDTGIVHVDGKRYRLTQISQGVDNETCILVERARFGVFTDEQTARIAELYRLVETERFPAITIEGTTWLLTKMEEEPRGTFKVYGVIYKP